MRDVLCRISKKIELNFEELAFLESQSGKPISQAREDIQASLEVFQYFAKLAASITGATFENSYTVRKPIGVVGLITSFNYPFLLMAWKVAPALAAGNTIVMKPAPSTPLSTLLFAQLTTEAGLPDGVFNVVLGGGDIGHALVTHHDVRMVSFTGSTDVGKKVAVECAVQLKPCSLELGGKNAAIVFPDAELDKAANCIVDGAFSNMGQNCCGISRLLIHEDIYEVFCEKIIAATSKLKIGDPALANTQFGPLGNV